jgi:hypothetical protein
MSAPPGSHAHVALESALFRRRAVAFPALSARFEREGRALRASRRQGFVLGRRGKGLSNARDPR